MGALRQQRRERSVDHRAAESGPLRFERRDRPAQRVVRQIGLGHRPIVRP